MHEFAGEENLPDFDDSLVKKYQREASSVDQYLEAVQYASDNEVHDPDGKRIAWETDGVRWVRSNRALHSWAVKAGFKMPGGPVALSSLAVSKYRAEQDNRRQYFWPIPNETPTMPEEE
jgi:hypothetical protein